MNNYWIFLRGLTRGNAHWAQFPEIFKEINPSAQVEFLELPGNGTVSHEDTPINAREVIDLIREKSWIVQKNIPFHICGISLGGMIALKWAEIYPQNIQTINIINSSLGQFSPFYRRLIPATYLQILNAAFNSDIAEKEKIILTITSNKFIENQRYLKIFTQFSIDYKVSKKNFIRQILLAQNIHIQNLPNRPLKIITSINDRLVHHSCSDKLVKYFGGTQYIHATAGHDLPLDDPQWVVEMLLKNSL